MRIRRFLPPLRLALAAAALLVASPRLAAQIQCPFTEPECLPAKPWVWVDPQGGAVPSTSFWVVVYWTDEVGLAAGTRSIVVNNQEVSGQWIYEVLEESPQGHAIAAQSIGLVMVPQTGGSVPIAASICNIGGQCSDPWASAYHYVPPPQVTADQAAVARPRGEPLLEMFRVVNPGFATATYVLEAMCEEPAEACSASADTVVVGAGDTAVVGVSYRLGEGGSYGSVGLLVRGEAGSEGFASTLALPMAGAGPPGGVGDRSDLTLVPRSMCATVAAGPGAAYECGALRVAHSLPATRVLNRARAPALLYNSDLAYPTPVVAAHLALPQPRPDSLSAVLTLNGTTVATKRFPGVQADTVRLALSFDASTRATGVYSYVLVVTGFTGGVGEEIYRRNGRMALVNRGASPYGRGWWVAGLEELLTLNEEEKLWIGGDGSTRLYRLTLDETGWAGPYFDRPDTIRADAATGGFVRTLQGGAKVYYDFAGRHVRTVNPLGHTTWFDHVSGPGAAPSRLSAIRLPAGGASYAYAFVYTGTTPILSEVVAPSVSETADSSRVVRIETSGRDVSRIWDPAFRVDAPVGSAYDYGKPNVRFDMAGQRIGARHDRLGVPTFFRYDAVGRLTGAALGLAPGDSIRRGFRAAESQGLTALVPQPDVYTELDGPLSTPDDRTRFYVDQWGAPVRVVDPLGRTTRVRRGHTRLPALVTSMTDASGREMSATYDDRGNLLSTSDWSTVATHGKPATTTYAYDARWELVTRTTLPEGEVSSTRYDDRGRPEWVQAGPDTARRTRYTYLPTTHPTAPGLVERVTMPATDAGTPVEQYEYDLLGNLSATRANPGVAAEVRAEALNDRIGRTVRSRTALNRGAAALTQANAQQTTSTLDIRDRVTHAETYGPAVTVGGTTYPAQTTVVDNVYDAEGSLLSVSRRSDPDPAGVGTITTTYRYDPAGRRYLEIAPDGTPGSLTDNPRDSTVFDHAGNVRRVRSRRHAEILAALPPASHDTLAETRMTYDALGRVLTRAIPGVRYEPITDGVPASGTVQACGAHLTDPNGYLRAYDPYPLYANATGCRYDVVADVETFQYDPVTGNVAQADNRDARVGREYHPSGALKAETQVLRSTNGSSWGLHSYRVEYEYDLNGRRRSVRHPTQLLTGAGNLSFFTTFGYDPATGSLAEVVDPMLNRYRWGYDAPGQLRSLRRGPGVDVLRDTFEYDIAGMVTAHSIATLPAAATGAATHVQQTFTYDAGGRLLSSLGVTGLVKQEAYGYSGMGTLRSSVVETNPPFSMYADPSRHRVNETYNVDAMGSVIGGASQTYRWDGVAFGSVDSKSNGTTTSTFQPGTGRLTQRVRDAWITTYHYDAAGNERRTQGRQTTTSSYEDRVSFYGADGRLRAVDHRTVPGDNQMEFEEYRYDALGRRVWTRTRRFCAPTAFRPEQCRRGSVRRTVWDGTQELWEIQMPGGDTISDATMENDTQPFAFARGSEPGISPYTDVTAFYGRVFYTYGLGVDRPVGVTRLGYQSAQQINSTLKGTLWSPGAFTFFPEWGPQGTLLGGVFHDGNTSRCTTLSGGQYCVSRMWKNRIYPYQWLEDLRDAAWHGTQLVDKADASGLMYRRNRYYDPLTGRFTQEDPIGLAGGLNLYGFAAGDPVNFSDPFGLCPRRPCRMSAEGLQRLRGAEELKLQEYDDGAGNITIGYGHVLRPGESYPNGITEEQAEQLYAADIGRIVNPYLERITANLNQNQVDALGIFIFNAGSGAFSSDVLPHINRRDFTRATAAMQQYVFARSGPNGPKVRWRGLVRRRREEVEFFNDPFPLGCDISDWVNKGTCSSP